MPQSSSPSFQFFTFQPRISLTKFIFCFWALPLGSLWGSAVTILSFLDLSLATELQLLLIYFLMWQAVSQVLWQSPVLDRSKGKLGLATSCSFQRLYLILLTSRESYSLSSLFGQCFSLNLLKKVHGGFSVSSCIFGVQFQFIRAEGVQFPGLGQYSSKFEHFFLVGLELGTSLTLIDFLLP